MTVSLGAVGGTGGPAFQHMAMPLVGKHPRGLQRHAQSGPAWESSPEKQNGCLHPLSASGLVGPLQQGQGFEVLGRHQCRVGNGVTR